MLDFPKNDPELPEGPIQSNVVKRGNVYYDLEGFLAGFTQSDDITLLLFLLSNKSSLTSCLHFGLCDLKALNCEHLAGVS